MAECDVDRYSLVNGWDEMVRAIWADAYIVGRAEGFREGTEYGRRNRYPAGGEEDGSVPG